MGEYRKYRVRCRLLKWYVDLYNDRGEFRSGAGPFDSATAAQKYADYTGHDCWDKMQG